MLALTRFVWAALSAYVAQAPVRASTSPPAAIAGTWEVERVEMDAQDPSRWPLPPNDPRLVGRVLVIAPGRVEFEDDKDLTCQQNAWPARRSTWADLFGKGYLRPRTGAHSSPAPEDFAITIPKGLKRGGIVVAQVLCPIRRPHAVAFPLDQWAAVAPSGELLVHRDAQVLLVLRRLGVNEKPTASFNCSQTATSTEQAICGRRDLASWDRSVAIAVRLAKARDAGHGTEIDATQAAWIQRRNACGADAGCIEKLQVTRVYELVGE